MKRFSIFTIIAITAMFANGQVQNTLVFDGYNDYVIISADASMNFTSAYTFESWVFRNSSANSYQPLFNRNAAGSDSEIEIYLQDDDHSFWFTVAHNRGGNFDYAYWPTVPADRWVHIAVVFNGTNVLVYYDGIYQLPIQNDTSFPPPTGNMNNSYISRVTSFSYEYLNGMQDEVRIWDVALTQSEIRENMHREIPDPESETALVAYYRFNETSGTILPDESANSNTGVLINMTNADWVSSTAPIPYYTVNNGNWNTNTTWATGQNAPVNSWASAIVGHAVNILGAADVNTLTINANSSLNIEGTLDVVDLENNGDITIVSTASGTGSMIQQNDITGTGNFHMQRYVTGNSWHLLGTSVIGSTSGVFTGDYLQHFDETRTTGNDGWNDIVPTNFSLNPLTGYGVWASIDKTYVMSGAPFPVSINPAWWTQVTTPNDNTFYHGWNLFANPYTAALDWDQIEANLNTAYIDPAMYIWDPLSETYLSRSSGAGAAPQFIPVGQAFFVHADGMAAIFHLPAWRSHTGAGNFYKDETNSILEVKVTNGEQADYTFIRFTDQSSADYDAMDAYKLMSETENSIQIYTTENGLNYSINTRPELAVMPMNFTAQKSGACTLTMDGTENWSELYIEDKLTGEVIEMTEGTSYEFSYSPDDPVSRFNIHFGPLSTDELTNEYMKVWSDSEGVMVTLESVQGQLNVYDLTGRLVSTKELKEGMNRQEVEKGFYIVEVLTQGQRQTKKVSVH